jgi:endo-1,4-beta-xylanase
LSASQLSKVPVCGLNAAAVIETFRIRWPFQAASFVYHKSHQSVDGLPLTSSKLLGKRNFTKYIDGKARRIKTIGNLTKEEGAPMHSPPFSLQKTRRRLARILGGSAAAALLALAGLFMPGVAKAATQICSNQTGTNAGYYYQMWSNGQGSACMTLNSGNSYSSTWSGIGDFVAGVGWNPGSNATVSFNGSMSASGGTSLLSVYGWSTNPLVEYYVMEDYVGSPNTAGTYLGQVTSDGGTYNLYEHQQVNQPSIQGTTTFEQYLAIRTSPTTSGTVTMQNFINAWASHGLNLGTLNYEILATESYGGGSGSSNVTVSQGSGGSSGGGGGAAAAAAAPRRCRPGRREATGTTSTSRSPALAAGR